MTSRPIYKSFYKLKIAPSFHGEPKLRVDQRMQIYFYYKQEGKKRFSTNDIPTHYNHSTSGRAKKTIENHYLQKVLKNRQIKKRNNMEI